jgi:hypothetical protein
MIRPSGSGARVGRGCRGSCTYQEKSPPYHVWKTYVPYDVLGRPGQSFRRRLQPMTSTAEHGVPGGPSTRLSSASLAAAGPRWLVLQLLSRSATSAFRPGLASTCTTPTAGGLQTPGEVEVTSVPAVVARHALLTARRRLQVPTGELVNPPKVAEVMENPARRSIPVATLP